jgi:hypothetical protein
VNLDQVLSTAAKGTNHTSAVLLELAQISEFLANQAAVLEQLGGPQMTNVQAAQSKIQELQDMAGVLRNGQLEFERTLEALK